MHPETLISQAALPATQDLIRKSFVKSVYADGGDIRKVFMKKDVNESDMDAWKTDTKRIMEVDKERGAGQKLPGQQSIKRGSATGYFKDIVRKTVSIGKLVTGEEFKALTAYDLADFALTTGEDVVYKIELDMRNFLGLSTGATSYVDREGFTVDLTVGDGLAVFSAVHTLKYSTTTYSNIISGAPSFSENSITSAEDFFNYSATDNFNKRIDIKANTIITSKKATMVNRVSRMLGSSAPIAVEGAANANSAVKNVNKDKYSHLVVEFDVDASDVSNSALSYYWFLASLGKNPEQNFQAWYVSWMSPTVSGVEVDQDRWIMSYYGRACYGIGALSGKGICVSKATS